MNYVDFTRQKLLFFRREVGRVRTSDFHNTAAKECLEILDELFAERLAAVDSPSARRDAQIQRNACIKANVDILVFQELLGFLLRSTNVRNPFELYEPIYQMAKDLLGSGARIILSSEWQFSPFTYPSAFKDLPGFAFIGLPATESENVLIIPLAGHELGHSVWMVHKVADKLASVLKLKVIQECETQWAEFERILRTTLDKSKLETDRVLRSFWVTPFQWSMSQAAEIFCDIVGVRAFGISYLQAFEYLVSPNFGPSRSERYPPLGRRIEYMIEAAQRFGMGAPAGYKDRFAEPRAQHRGALDELLLKISDDATRALVPDISAQVADICARAIPMPSVPEAERIYNDLKERRPSDGVSALADAVNAGWRALLDEDVWKHPTEAGRRFEILGELLCKTIEVSEFRRKTG